MDESKQSGKMKVLQDLITAMEDREASKFGAKPILTIAISGPEESDDEGMTDGMDEGEDSGDPMLEELLKKKRG